MVSTVTLDVRTFPDAQALSRAAAQSLVGRIRATIRIGARFYLALAGGNTPRSLYRLLATEYRDAIRWDQVHFRTAE
jgi:6-phosphogluconolactonase